MEEILHQFNMVNIPFSSIFYRVSYISGGAGFQPSTVPVNKHHTEPLEQQAYSKETT